MRLHLHSVVDLITNSSTEIYTNAHGESVKIVKRIIDSVLIAAGSDKRADDLFEIKVVPSEYSFEKAAEEYMYEHGIEYSAENQEKAEALIREQFASGERKLEDGDTFSYGSFSDIEINPLPGFLRCRHNAG